MPPELLAAIPHGAWFLLVTVLYVLLEKERKARIADIEIERKARLESEANARVERDQLRAELAAERAARAEEMEGLIDKLLAYSREALGATKENTQATRGVEAAATSLGSKLDRLIELRHQQGG
jgi:hypothetical protein